MVKLQELRKGKVDEFNELSDSYIINESYQLGEWEKEKRIVNCWKCNAENEENENFNFCVECLTHL